MQAKFGWHFENFAYTPDCLGTADAERIRNDGAIRQLLEEEMLTLKVREIPFLQSNAFANRMTPIAAG